MLFMWMPLHMPHVRIVNVTYHLGFSSAVTMGPWYFFKILKFFFSIWQ